MGIVEAVETKFSKQSGKHLPREQNQAINKFPCWIVRTIILPKRDEALPTNVRVDFSFNSSLVKN